MSETRKLAAILVADVVGYSRLAGADEDRTLARLRGLRSDLIDPAIAAHRGRIVKRTSDGSITEFRSAVDAVRCAIEIQTGLAFATTRADARYCSARCRQRAHRSSITPPPDDHEQQERR
jgi:class 3 adenylate cyclase